MSQKELLRKCETRSVCAIFYVTPISRKTYCYRYERDFCAVISKLENRWTHFNQILYWRFLHICLWKYLKLREDRRSRSGLLLKSLNTGRLSSATCFTLFIKEHQKLIFTNWKARANELTERAPQDCYALQTCLDFWPCLPNDYVALVIIIDYNMAVVVES
jgi:hypothetical protein